MALSITCSIKKKVITNSSVLVCCQLHVSSRVTPHPNALVLWLKLVSLLSGLHTANLSLQTGVGKLEKVGKVVRSHVKLASNHNTRLICNMADVVQWHSRRVATYVLILLNANRRRRNRNRWNNRKVWTKPYISRNLTHKACVFIRCRRNVPQIWTILSFEFLDELKSCTFVFTSVCHYVTQIT